jgi:hypothetical protein
MEYEERAKAIFLQHVFDQQLTINTYGIELRLTDEQVIPDDQRVKMYKVERDEEYIAKLAKSVEECNLYITQQ